MEWMIALTAPMPSEDLRKLEDILRGEDVFVPFFAPTYRDPYAIATYLEEQLVWRRPVSLFVDRNVMSRWVSLMNGETATDSHRVASAILAFAQAAELLVEPSIAVHEYAAFAGTRKAKADLIRFYQADNVPAVLWTDVALGRRDTLPPQPRPNNVRRIPKDLDKRLYRWERNYIVLLKVAQLHMEGGSSIAKMSELLRWMYHDFIMAGPATIFAAYYFAPNAPKKRLLKNIEASDRERAIRGIKNAAWDLMLLSDWARRVMGLDQMDDERPSPVLCTVDEAIKRIAKHVIVFDEDDISYQEGVSRMFHSIWDRKSAERLTAQYATYESDLDNPTRHFKRTNGLDFIPAMIADGERVVRGG